jgi:hypothetical protein
MNLGDIVEMALCPKGMDSNLDDDSRASAHETAYAVMEILDSNEKIVEICKQLAASESREAALELLEDFREELRHVLYHVEASDFLSVIIGSTHVHSGPATGS